MSREGVVVYFQPARRDTVPPPLQRREVQELHRDVGRDARALQELSSPEVRTLIEDALDRAHLTKDQAARMMGITPSLLGRQLQNLDNQHVSMQRLWLLTDLFWRELLVGIVERRKLARVRRRLIFEGL